MENSISVNIAKNFLLENICCQIPDHKITAIIGPNGSGKSTLVKTMTGVLPLDQGEILLSEKELTSYSRKQLAKKIAYLAQSNSIPGDMTVRDLVALGRYCHHPWWRRYHKGDDKVIDDALAQVNLDELGEKTLSTLSGGQQQRAYLAMSLAQQTPVLILDEPTNGLDVTQQYCFLSCLQTLKNQQQKTIVMVMHDIQQAYHFSDYCLAMNDGKLVAQGNTKEVLTSGLVKDIFKIKSTHPYLGVLERSI